MKQAKEQQLIEAMKSKYQCRITADEIIAQTDFFDNHLSKKMKRIYKYKYAFLTSLFVLFLVVISFTTLTIRNHIANKNAGYDNNKIIHVKNDDEVMKEEYRLYIDSICDKVSYDPIYFVQVKSNTTLYVYRGYNVEEYEMKKFYYFYILETGEDDINTTYLKVNNNVISFTSISNCGILEVIREDDIGNNQLLTIDYSDGEIAKTYAFSY